MSTSSRRAPATVPVRLSEVEWIGTGGTMYSAQYILWDEDGNLRLGDKASTRARWVRWLHTQLNTKSPNITPTVVGHSEVSPQCTASEDLPPMFDMDAVQSTVNRKEVGRDKLLPKLLVVSLRGGRHCAESVYTTPPRNKVGQSAKMIGTSPSWPLPATFLLKTTEWRDTARQIMRRPSMIPNIFLLCRRPD